MATPTVNQQTGFTTPSATTSGGTPVVNPSTGFTTGTKPVPVYDPSDQYVLIVGLIVGFFVIPPLARANPPLVNGFLFLVLFSSLLYNRNRWLPYFQQFSRSINTKG